MLWHGRDFLVRQFRSVLALTSGLFLLSASMREFIQPSGRSGHLRATKGRAPPLARREPRELAGEQRVAQDCGRACFARIFAESR